MTTKILRVFHDDITEFTISSTPYTLNVAFPVVAESIPDCLCPILIMDNDGCDNLKRCYCADEAELLNSAAELNVCHNSSTEQLTLYMHNNIPPTANNTRLHFYKSFLCVSPGPERYSITHFYTDSLEIRQGNKLVVIMVTVTITIIIFIDAVIPKAPEVNIAIGDDGHYEICFQSNSTLADKYKINVSDITGETIYCISVLNNINNYCTYIPFELKVECAPFVVSVTAENYFGNSSINTTINLPNQPVASNNGVCSCLFENCKLLITN